MNGVRNYAGTGAKDFNEETDWWKKFTTKQRILLGSIVAVIILALVILAVVVGKPNMVTLIECSSTAQAGEVKDLLDNDGSILSLTATVYCSASYALAAAICIS